jgi:hypothetical protein
MERPPEGWRRKGSSTATPRDPPNKASGDDLAETKKRDAKNQKKKKSQDTQQTRSTNDAAPKYQYHVQSFDTWISVREVWGQRQVQ